MNLGIDFWRTTGIIMAAIGQTSFVALYLFFPWWERFLGRALFFMAVAFMVLVNAAVLGRLYDWPHEDITFVTLYWLVAWAIWVQFGAFLRVQVQNRRDEVSRNGRE